MSGFPLIEFAQLDFVENRLEMTASKLQKHADSTWIHSLYCMQEPQVQWSVVSQRSPLWLGSGFVSKHLVHCYLRGFWPESQVMMLEFPGAYT